MKEQIRLNLSEILARAKIEIHEKFQELEIFIDRDVKIKFKEKEE